MPQNVRVKTILNKTKRRDSWFLDDYTINPYGGCSFNCLYCYIRGSKYGINMEQSLSVKENAVELLDKQLFNRAKKAQWGIIVLSSATDPYLQFEEDLLITRQLLEIILKHKFPVHVITKSNLVVRDFDLLQKIDQTALLPLELRSKLNRGVIVTFSFSTLDAAVNKIFEPGATPPQKRLEALKAALNAGFKSGVSLMPLLPYITDTGAHLELMFSTFSRLGANYVMPASISLFGKEPSHSKTLVMRAIKKHYPHLERKYRRFFEASDRMPDYYHKALRIKTLELSRHYGLRPTIIDL